MYDTNVYPVLDCEGHVTTLAVFTYDITKRTRAEQALRESEARYRALVELAPDAVFVFRDEHVLYANHAASQLYGFDTFDPARNTSLFEMIAPEDHDLLRERLRQIARGEEIPYTELQFIRVDGQRRFIEANAVAITWQGQPAFQSVTRDITERKRTEQVFRESQACFRQFFERNHAVMLFIDPHSGNILDANPTACDFYGYPLAELTSMHVGELNRDTPEEFQRKMTWVLDEDCRYITSRHHLAGGEMRDVDVYCGPLVLDGRTVIYTIVHDVTERTRIEHELARERAFLHAALDTLPLPLVFITPEGEFFQQNMAAQRLHQQLGVTCRADMHFLDPQLRTPIPPEQRPVVRALRGEVVAAEEYLITASGYPHRLPALISTAPIRIDNDVVAAVSIIEDITRLKDADRAKDEFLAVLSHELQTPLTSILGWADLALAKDDPAFMPRALQVINRNAERLRLLIAGMLDMSRIIHRKMALSPILIDARLQALHAVENVQCQADEQSRAVALRLNAEPLPVLADPVRLQQCLDNLLHNSLKFTAAGGQVTLSCRREGAEAIIAVQDSGRGVAPHLLSTLFDPFTQVNRDERHGGLGLGLAITRGIIELHGGRIWAESPGEAQGCTITIALPLRENAQPVAANLSVDELVEKLRGNTVQHHVETPPPASAVRHILVVDDAPDIRELVTTILESAGYATLLAGDGAEGLALVATQHIDLVIMDINMPGMDGREACRRLKKHTATRHLPVLILTARSQPLEREISLNVAQADGVLHKPFERQELLDLVKIMLAEKR